MLGVRGTVDKIKSANGPAQHLLLAGWGVVCAGMFDGMGVPDPIIIMWAMTSMFVFIAVVWLPLVALQWTLVLDFFLSVCVFYFYSTYDPMPLANVYYTNTMSGMEMAHRDVQAHGIAKWAHYISLWFMASHALYLANLVQRQRLERMAYYGHE